MAKPVTLTPPHTTPQEPMYPTSGPANVTRSSSNGLASGIQKRTRKACDRCRLRRSKCDGSSPCSRCKVDNTICVFGAWKRPQEKIYPKGYAEMLEQQQSQLVSGLQEMYNMLQKASAWDWHTLDESSGQPLTHDILSALGLLESKHSGSSEVVAFEEDCANIRSKMISGATGNRELSRSVSAALEHDRQEWSPTALPRNGTPHPPDISLYQAIEKGSNATSSSLITSPVSKSKSLGQCHTSQTSAQHVPIRQTPTSIECSQVYSSDWTQSSHDLSGQNDSLNCQYGECDALSSLWEPMQVPFDQCDYWPSLQLPMASSEIFGTPCPSDLPPLYPTDFDFSNCTE